jgi:hypothetical protein
MFSVKGRGLEGKTCATVYALAGEGCVVPQGNQAFCNRFGHREAAPIWSGGGPGRLCTVVPRARCLKTRRTPASKARG